MDGSLIGRVFRQFRSPACRTNFTPDFIIRAAINVRLNR